MIWIIISLFIIICIVLILSKIYIIVSLEYLEDKQILHAYIKLYGIRIFKRRIDLSKLDTSNSWENTFKDKNFKESLEYIYHVTENFFEMVNDIAMATRIFLNRLSVHKLEWYTNFGTGEASGTGLAAGGIWTVKGYMIGLLDNLSQLKCTPDLQVTPYFQGKFIYSKFDCMVSIRIGQAIHALIKVIRKSSFRKKEALI
ncbi:DUF2953 domain-containing protein [Virgibacillus sp. FSP13]